MSSPSFRDYIARQKSAQMHLADAAINLGVPVFPCGADKSPITTHGFKDASADPDIIRQAFRPSIAVLIGMPTGAASGVIVIDVDMGEGKQGRVWLDDNSHRLPQTRTIRSRAGGLHLYLNAPSGLRVKNQVGDERNTKKIALHIDVRGDGGYVIVPPSPNYSVADDSPVADIPDWLLPLLCPPEPVQPPPAPRRALPALTEGGSHYGLTALDGECSAIRTAGFGAQEHTLNAAGLKIGALVAGGEVEEGLALAELLSAARGVPSQQGKPAWTARELENKIRRAFQDGMRRPRAAPESTMEREVEIVHPAAPMLLQMRSKAAQTAIKPLPVSDDLMAVEGILKMLVDDCNRTAIRPQPFLALGAAICAVGVLAGRRYRNQTDLRTNIYIASIAESGGGKDHAVEVMRVALGDAGLDAYLGGETIASGRGVLTSLEQHPARLFQIDELGMFLRSTTGKQAPGHRAEIWTELMKLYSRAKGTYRGTEYANQKENARVNLQQPHVCFNGTTTPSTFWAALEGGAMLDGSLARFLTFVTDTNRPPRNRTPEIFKTSEGLRTALQAVASGAAGHDYGGNLSNHMLASVVMEPYTVPMEAAAFALHEAKLDEEDVAARKVEGTPKAAVVNRTGENAAKLALVRAISRDPGQPVIHEVDVAWGWALSEHCIATLLADADRFLAEGPFEQKLNRALHIIRKYGPISNKALFRRGLKLPEREREEVLRALISGGMIQAYSVEPDPIKGGRPTIRYAATPQDDLDPQGDD